MTAKRAARAAYGIETRRRSLVQLGASHPAHIFFLTLPRVTGVNGVLRCDEHNARFTHTRCQLRRTTPENIPCVPRKQKRATGACFMELDFHLSANRLIPFSVDCIARIFLVIPTAWVRSHLLLFDPTARSVHRGGHLTRRTSCAVTQMPWGQFITGGFALNWVELCCVFLSRPAVRVAGLGNLRAECRVALVVVASLMMLGHVPGQVIAQVHTGTPVSPSYDSRGPSSPDLVFILTDDQGIDAMQGPTWPNTLDVHTPRLAALAEQGTVFPFTRVDPVCSPTRSGVLTGRYGLRTGVMDRLAGSGDMRDYVSLQTEERTMAEMLRDAGYYTIMVDKWHLGASLFYGQRPTQQGFDMFIDGDSYIRQDEPLEVGDEHITRMVDLTLDAIDNAPPGQPIALFFWTRDPHQRSDPREEFLWWRVHERLLPSGEDYYAEPETNTNRYRAVVEAVDTEVHRLLHSLNIVDDADQYIETSDTVVFVMSDNGTPPAPAFRAKKAKGTLFEGGVRVPMFVFGEGVPTNVIQSHRLVSHVDLYDTVGDIIDADDVVRGEAPRDSMSFADALGWAPPRPHRAFQLSVMGEEDPEDHRLGLANRRFKLRVRTGGVGLAPLSEDEFYDLSADPLEQYNLVGRGMSEIARANYIRMRQEIASIANIAVSEPLDLMVDVPILDIATLNAANQWKFNQPFRQGFMPSSRETWHESRVFMRVDLADVIDRLPQGRGIDDIAGAQIVIAFSHDQNALSPWNNDTGPLTAHPLTRPWVDEWPAWDDAVDAFADLDLGHVDLAPHLAPSLGDGNAGMPMPPGTLISLGEASGLATWLRDAIRGSAPNHGIVLTTSLASLTRTGDQSIYLMDRAFIRLRFVPEH